MGKEFSFFSFCVFFFSPFFQNSAAILWRAVTSRQPTEYPLRHQLLHFHRSRRFNVRIICRILALADKVILQAPWKQYNLIFLLGMNCESTWKIHPRSSWPRNQKPSRRNPPWPRPLPRPPRSPSPLTQIPTAARAAQTPPVKGAAPPPAVRAPSQVSGSSRL